MEPSFIEYLIKQTIQRPDRMVEAFLVLLAVMLLFILVAIFRRPNRNAAPKFQMPEPALSSLSEAPRKAIFSQSIPTQSTRAVANIDMTDLLDIEEALLALRELYHRKLIPSHVYIDESMKHAARLKR
jgi:hypothetical protein